MRARGYRRFDKYRRSTTLRAVHATIRSRDMQFDSTEVKVGFLTTKPTLEEYYGLWTSRTVSLQFAMQLLIPVK